MVVSFDTSKKRHPRVTQKDRVYVRPRAEIEDFRFDQKVANVFQDMAERSIPGYRLLLDLIGTITRNYATPATNLYDLGCSLGAGTIQLQKNSPENCQVIGVDSSEAMIKNCIVNLKKEGLETKTEIRRENIEATSIENASIILLNWTLQFIENDSRNHLIRNIYASLNKGGVLILSEKISSNSEEEQKTFGNLHELFKQEKGYSLLEIAQKRKAIEKVLIPDTEQRHHKRLEQAGFKKILKYFQSLNFVSFLAIK